MSSLSGKVAIVTGASSGIGRSAATLFAAEGAKVVVTARRREDLEALVAEIAAAGGEAAAVAGDVTSEDVAAAVVAAAETRFGGLDIAFNNAGDLGEMGPAETISLKGWNHTLAVNLTGAFLGARAQIPAMLRRGAGSIIFTSTFVGQTAGFPGMAAYAAAKAGLMGLVRVLAVELGPKAIRANAIVSGGVDTPMGRSVASSPDSLAFVSGLHALKRIASSDELAQAALWLASDRSSFVTGAALPVDGGVSVNKT